MVRVKRIKATSVRGLPRAWAELEIGDRGLLVYGPNGVGKSSIVDAVEFALTGSTTVFPFARQGVSWARGGPHKRDGAPEIILTFSASGGVTPPWCAGTDTEALPRDVQRWREQARTANFVLRRHKLIEFVVCQPADRYASLAQFLRLDAVDRIEQGLRRERGRLEAQRARLETEGQRLLAQVRTTFSIPAGMPPNRSALAGDLMNRLAALGMAGGTTEAELSAAESSLKEQLGRGANAEAVAGLVALQGQVGRLGTLADLDSLLTALAQAVEERDTVGAAARERMPAQWLRAGEAGLPTEARGPCPLCESDIDVTSVQARLQARIAECSRVVAASERVDVVRTQVLEDARAHLARLQSFGDEWSRVVGATLPASVVGAIDRASAVIEQVAHAGIESKHVEATRLLASVPPDYCDATAALKAAFENAGGSRYVELSRVLQMLHAWVSTLPAADRSQAKVRDILRLEAGVEALRTHAVQARRAVAQEVLETVCQRANDYYTRIHPSESVTGSRLSVRPAVDRSVDFAAIFDGVDEHPLLRLSESHLDTLGLAYFLAIRRAEADLWPEFRLLVLDDVLHSVDAEHRQRVVFLLRDEFADHQILQTTHDRIFFQLLRTHMGGGGFASIALHGWTLNDGPALSDAELDFDRIRAPCRDTTAPEVLAAAAGRAFECVLRNLTEEMQIAVRARFRSDHTIADLWPPLRAKLSRQRSFATAHPDLANAIEANVWVRNACGAHHNEPASPVTPAEATSFAELVERLVNATLCNDCGRFIAKQVGGHWTCACGSTRYQS